MSESTQLERERRALHFARSKALEELKKAVASGNVEQLPAGRVVIARLFHAVRDELQAICENQSRGPGAALKHWLRVLDLDVLTVLVLRNVIHGILMHGMNASIQRLASMLGYSIVQEVRVRDVEKVNPVYLDRAVQYLKTTRTVARRHVQRTMDAVIKNVIGRTEDLSNSELIMLGKHGIAACYNVGMIKLNRRHVRGKEFATYELADEVAGTLTDFTFIFPHPNPGAMLVPPLPWTDYYNGGYLLPDLRRRFPAMSFHLPSTRKSTRAARRQSIDEAPQVLQVMNYLQSHAFELHQPTRDLLIRLWETGRGGMGLPSRLPAPKPEFPHPEGWDKADASSGELEEFSNWKRHMSLWHTQEMYRRGVEVDAAEMVKQHRELGDAPVYYPMMIDFRNRMYYHGNPNPQGSDPGKACVHFREKKPLGQRGLFWLKVSIANSFGQDKTRMRERVKWVDDNWNTLQEAVRATRSGGLAPLWGSTADTPFAAYSACTELLAAYESGTPEQYCTGIPVHMDATCSGLQHFSAMLRDPVGGHYTNLVDTGADTKADIYARVLELVRQRLERDASPLHPQNIEARAWLGLELKRDLTKRPTMTYVYGVTHRGVSDHCQEYLEGLGVNLDPKLGRSMAYYMADVLFDSLAGAVPAAAKCMQWLRELAKACPKDTPICWKNPLGLTVVQDYLQHTEKRVHLRSAGIDYVIVREQTEKTKVKRMTNGICPNFIHSMDASHLGLVALQMQNLGLSTVAVHDSIGTHPSDVDTLHSVIRSTFVDMYKQDHLGNLLQDVGITMDLPEKGNLDLTKVLTSEFFFC